MKKTTSFSAADLFGGFADRIVSTRRFQRNADKAAHKLLASIADRVSDKAIDPFVRPDYTEFMEGSGYFISTPKENARWSVGFAKRSILPQDVSGPLYLGGYLNFPPNKVSGVLDDLCVRVSAVSDGSGRGIHVFASIDCVGISNTDVCAVRKLLHREIAEYNIESLNVCATHCHSGVDTLGLWGDLIQALCKNPRLVKSAAKAENAVSGRNPEFMKNLLEQTADCVREALAGMLPCTVSCAVLDGSAYIRDKRPPDVVDTDLTVIRFSPEGKRPLFWVLFGAHPTCFGPDQQELSGDFPYHLCTELENLGFDAVFFQGAELAVATDRSKTAHPGETTYESIVGYGRALARFVAEADDRRYRPVEPILNVRLDPLLLPAENPLLLLAAKLRLVNSKLKKFETGKGFDYCFRSEIGFAEFGRELRVALIPGELAPELAVGGAPKAEASWSGADWPYPPMKDAFSGKLAVIGLCNDCVGYIVPDNDYGSFFAPKHYEEAVSAGRKTASNLISAFFRTVENAERGRL